MPSGPRCPGSARRCGVEGSPARIRVQYCKQHCQAPVDTPTPAGEAAVWVFNVRRIKALCLLENSFVGASLALSSPGVARSKALLSILLHPWMYSYSLHNKSALILYHSQGTVFYSNYVSM